MPWILQARQSPPQSPSPVEPAILKQPKVTSPAVSFFDQQFLVLIASPLALTSQFVAMADRLDLNPAGKLAAQTFLARHYPSSHPSDSDSTTRSFSINEILQLGVIDDPDGGMDSHLPSSGPDHPVGNRFDPLGEREILGGAQGMSSQSFRHLFYRGWSWRAPLQSLQYPARPLGQAKTRYQRLFQQSQQLLSEGDFFWASVTLGWSLHYLQDLTQPFHTAQLPSLALIPWPQWQASPFFQTLLDDTTRVTTNYHWAYEDYVRYRLEHLLPSATATPHPSAGDLLPLEQCLVHPEDFTPLRFQPTPAGLDAVLDRVLEQSQNLAPPLGRALLAFFGPQMKAVGVDFTKNTQMIGFAALALDPSKQQARRDVEQLTCQALANAAIASHWTLDRLRSLTPSPTPSPPNPTPRLGP